MMCLVNGGDEGNNNKKKEREVFPFSHGAPLYPISFAYLPLHCVFLFSYLTSECDETEKEEKNEKGEKVK
jgi:hypothetical protein